MSKALELADVCAEKAAALKELAPLADFLDRDVSFFLQTEAELRRLAAVEAERDMLKEQMRDVAMLLLDNDRSGIEKWARGIVVGEIEGQWSVRTVLADQEKEIAELRAELERIRALEPVAWRDPSNLDPSQSVTFLKERHLRWPHIYSQPLYALTPKDPT